MHKKPVIILSAVVLIVLAVWLIYHFIYNKPHREIANKKPAIQVQAHVLFNTYSTDEIHADSLYLNKVLQVRGVVEEILTNEQGGTTIVLKGTELFGISCAFGKDNKQNLGQIKVGDTITLKGLCNGMLMGVVLVNCVLIK